MKKRLPIIFGFMIPFVLFVYSFFKSPEIPTAYVSEITSPPPDVLGVSVTYGDKNVVEHTYTTFHLDELKKIFDGASGTYSIYIKNLNTGQIISVNEGVYYYPASLYKIPMAIKVLEKVENAETSFDYPITYAEDNLFSGSGTIKNEPFGTQLTVEQLLTGLIRESDNVAQNMLFSVITENDVLELMPRPEIVTTSDIAQILEDIFLKTYLNDEMTTKLLDLMSKTSFDNRINAGLVKGISFSHKIGNWGSTGSWHDCGIVDSEDTDLVVCLMSKGTSFEDFLRVSKNIGAFVSTLK